MGGKRTLSIERQEPFFLLPGAQTFIVLEVRRFIVVWQ